MQAHKWQRRNDTQHALLLCMRRLQALIATTTPFVTMGLMAGLVDSHVKEGVCTLLSTLVHSKGCISYSAYEQRVLVQRCKMTCEAIRRYSPSCPASEWYFCSLSKLLSAAAQWRQTQEAPSCTVLPSCVATVPH